MKRHFIYIWLFLTPLNYAKGNPPEIMNEKYYYKIVSINRKEDANEGHLYLYMLNNVSFKNDSIFMRRTYFDMDFKKKREEQNIFIKKDKDLYSVQSNGTRLFLSIATHEAVVYFRDPYFEATNNIYGRIHWYLGTDTISDKVNKKRIRHKFFVQIGFPLTIGDKIPLKKSDYLGKSEYIEYRYYDENFILLSTEYAGDNNLYYSEKERICPFFKMNIK